MKATIPRIFCGRCLLLLALVGCAGPGLPAQETPAAPVNAELPREYVDTALAEPDGDVVHLVAGEDFQAALERARPGDVIELARGGHRGTFYAAGPDRAQYLPPRLSTWLSDDSSKNRPRRHGKSRFANWGRDLHIAWAVYSLEQHGIKPTRNNYGVPASGCDIVADVLTTQFRKSITYATAKGIWHRYAHS